MTFKITVKADLRGFKSLQKALKVDLRRSSSRSLRIAMTKASNILQQYLQRRFISLSSGKGEWDENEESTIRKKGHGRILRDKGDLFKSIDTDMSSKGFFVGFVRNNPHPRFNGTVRRLAEIHTDEQIPRRRVLAPPPLKTITKMAQAIKAGYLATFEGK